MKFKNKVWVLEKEPTEDQVKLYLLWLATSKYYYHIDGDVEDVIWNPEIGKGQVKVLKKNSKRMWKKYSSHFLWENYPIIEMQLK